MDRFLKIKSFQIFRYNIPLKFPLAVGQQKLSVRTGLLLCLQDETGQTAWGDASALEGVSVQGETIQALKEIKNLKNNLLSREFFMNPTQWGNGFEQCLGTLKLPSSVRFGIETAVLNLLAQSTRRPVSTLLNPSCAKIVKINGLLDAVFHMADDGRTVEGFLLADNHRDRSIHFIGIFELRL